MDRSPFLSWRRLETRPSVHSEMTGGELSTPLLFPVWSLDQEGGGFQEGKGGSVSGRIAGIRGPVLGSCQQT